jgi:hypothetical protein
MNLLALKLGIKTPLLILTGIKAFLSLSVLIGTKNDVFG